ncbi:MAG: hypothetical protein L6Q76_36650, partial [Polyangiaceae bacterium]|nr:hypothetical protein [Polyangiaceae bacterium]
CARRPATRAYPGGTKSVPARRDDCDEKLTHETMGLFFLRMKILQESRPPSEENTVLRIAANWEILDAHPA